MIRNKFAMTAALSCMLYRDDTVGADGTGGIVTEAPPAAPNGFTKMVPQSFHFKTEKIRDDKGAVVGAGKKIPSANLHLPVPTTERLVQILQGGEEFAKERALIEQAVQDIIYGMARGQINEWREKDENKESAVTATVLDYSKLDWTAIANMPARERASSIPSDEDIQAFLDLYLQVMPTALNKAQDKIETHVNLFKAGFKKQRGQKDLLEVFQAALGVFATTVTTEQLEDNLPVVEYFANKLDRFLKTEEKVTMDMI